MKITKERFSNVVKFLPEINAPMIYRIDLPAYAEFCGIEVDYNHDISRHHRLHVGEGVQIGS